ncbi:AGE family epimerase/isomerase [Lutimonas sp.]|uniref:AGE family epimerase/isomerase n=1 Tax=Lutimonas sp. TaxID=1872403 RepID=UPI003C706A62
MNEQDTSRLLQLKVEFSDELTSILEFWSTKCLDETHEGFIGSMDHYGNVDPKASKGCILNTRILWTFSAAYRTTNLEVYKTMAKRAYDYLTKYFWDHQYGGLYWELDHRGAPLDRKKQAYVQGFGIYAFSEYYRSIGVEESLDYAKALFQILEEKYYDFKNTGYLEALTEDWKEIDDMRLSLKDLNTPKSMNTHLHILEPYSNLYRVWPNEKLKMAISSLLHIFCKKIYNPYTKHLKLFFSLDWKSQFEEISFGHDIEGAWLMNEASILVNNGTLDKEVHSITKQLVLSTLNEGLDKDGSLFNEIKGSQLDTDKHWWPQAEAMVGFLDAYELEGKKTYLEQVEKLWIFINNFLKDRENGEWFWRVNADNIPITSEDKAGFWKCPYHSGRALMELMERIAKLTDRL